MISNPHTLNSGPIHVKGRPEHQGGGVSDQIPPKKRLIAWRMRSLRVTDLVGVPYLKALSKTMPSLTLLLSL